jgi:hypothetical protein
MKKYILAVIAVIVLSLPLSTSAAGAKDKVTVMVEADTINIHVGNIQYVSDAVTPHVLKAVRVWNKPDSIKADEDLLTITHYVNGVANPSDLRFKQSEISANWTKRLKEFEALREKIEVYVLKPAVPTKG